MELRLYLQILRRGWWIIALTTLTALTSALAVSYLITPQYKAVARFIITPGNSLVDQYEVLNSLATLDRQTVVSTFAEVMNSERIYTDALSFLQLQPVELKKYKYEAVVISSTSVLELSVTGEDPQRAANLANAIGYQTINFTRQLNQVYNFDFLDIAIPPDEPYIPNTFLNMGLAIAFGLLLGGGLAILNEQLRSPLESLKQRRHFDEMTGVYNSKYFSRLVDDELARHPVSILSIGIVELNGLRDLTETLPIVSLQIILQKVTDVLRKELRGNDVIGRWNDFSFIVMLPNTPGTAANSIFDRIFQALLEPIDLSQFDLTIQLDPHIGGAEYSNNISTQELFEKVDSALEQARRAIDEPVYVWEFRNPFWTQPMMNEK